jgi:DNA-binding transcriptional MocR family regulator
LISECFVAGGCCERTSPGATRLIRFGKPAQRWGGAGAGPNPNGASKHAIIGAINSQADSLNDIAHHWARSIRESSKPAYLALPDLIAYDIKAGRLTVADRLPPLREVAERLGLNYTTVARGYAEARRRGLIDSRAGRGTYIRAANASLQPRRGSLVEMTMNLPPESQDPALLARLREGFASLHTAKDIYALLRYQEFGGTAEDREAGARWLRHRLPDASPDRVLVCPGIQSTLVALMALLAGPGEVICAEALTYPGVKAIAAQLGVRVHPLPMDGEGIDARAFEAACKSLKPKVLYCNPTLLNPTTVVISQARREALADVALRYSVAIIEDDAYGMLPSRAPTPFALLAPNLTYYITGFAKCVGAGLRVAYLMAPNVREAKRVSAALRSATVMASPVTTVLATRWVNDDTADLMLAATRKESVERQKLAARLLPAASYTTHPEAFHGWLRLPEPWHRMEFASHLRARGVGVVGAEAFCLDGNPPEAVRICLGGGIDRDECRHLLELIHDALAHAPAAAM